MNARARTAALLGFAGLVLALGACSPAGNPEAIESPSASPSSTPAGGLTDLEKIEALMRIDLGFLSTQFSNVTYGNPGTQPVMAAGDGQLTVHDLWKEQLVPDAELTVWGPDPDNACLEYANADVTIHALNSELATKTGPCPGEHKDAGVLESPTFTQPGTYMEYSVAPFKGPCYYESTAEFAGVGEQPAWIVVDCSSDKWTWQVVGGGFATQEEFDAGLDEAYGESMCNVVWDRAAKAGAKQFYWSWPEDIHWSHGERGVLCMVSWEPE